MNVLLAYPRFPITYWGFQYGLHLVSKQATLPPLGLLTVAALLPGHWHLRLVDLNVRGLHDDDLRWADVVLTGGLLVQAGSMREIIARAAAFRLPVAVGGPAPTASPGLFPEADVVFRGEAEGRIDALVRALGRRSGTRITLEAPASFPDMARVPVPRYDLLDLSNYASMSVQYSRGCPFQCEFCDVVEIFGRRSRVKTPEQIVEELEAIHRMGYRGTIFFVDDNFIGNKSAVKRLLSVMHEWQRSRGRPFDFYTEASINLAHDPHLLEDMVDAGFSSVFVGIESPSKKALEGAKKFQNLRVDLSEAVDRITRAGIEVMGGFIVGFDSDGEEVFALQREFLAGQPIPLAMVGLLTALPGTALCRRLKAEGRLRERSSGDQFSRPNFAPVMEEGVLLRGYMDLMSRLYSPRAYYSRCEAYVDRAGAFSESRSTTFGEIGALLRTIWHVGVLSPRRRHFWRLMFKAFSRGRSHIHRSVAHAVIGEHLIRYTRRHLVPRMKRALAELRAGIDLSPRPLPADRGVKQAGEGTASPGAVRLPSSLRRKAPLLSALSGGPAE
jgi:radical SAM superfamily enzyme YgiQ (UPF0313 family)